MDFEAVPAVRAVQPVVLLGFKFVLASPLEFDFGVVVISGGVLGDKGFLFRGQEEVAVGPDDEVLAMFLDEAAIGAAFVVEGVEVVEVGFQGGEAAGHVASR
jgi:hypothetical protein